MKNKIYLIALSFSILFCCNSSNRVKEDFFYSTIKPEIYSINNEKEMVTYNILDSTINRFIINKNDLFSMQNDTLPLLKFQLEDIDLEELKDTKWLLKFEDSKQKYKQTLNINETGDMFLSQKDSEELFIPFNGFLFDKFYSYKFNSVILLINCTDSILEVLNIDYINNKVNKYALKKIQTNGVD